MYGDHVRMNGGSESDITAEARELQGRHAPRLLMAAARQLRGLSKGGTGERAIREHAFSRARQSTAH